MNFTKNALNQFKKLIDENENPKSGIRFYTVQGCCSPSLQMNIVESPSPGDVEIQMNDVNIFITPEAEKMLMNITIDYTEEGFRSVKKSDEPSSGKCC